MSCHDRFERRSNSIAEMDLAVDFTTPSKFSAFTIQNVEDALKGMFGHTWYTGIDLPENWTDKEQKELESYIEPLRLG